MEKLYALMVSVPEYGLVYSGIAGGLLLVWLFTRRARFWNSYAWAVTSIVGIAFGVAYYFHFDPHLELVGGWQRMGMKYVIICSCSVPYYVYWFNQLGTDDPDLSEELRAVSVTEYRPAPVQLPPI